MGEVSRGIIVALVVLTFSGSVAPVTPPADWHATENTVPSPASPDRSHRQSSIDTPSVDRVDPLARDLWPAATVASQDAADAGDTIALTQQFQRLPDRPGTVRVALRYRIPDRVFSLHTDLPAGATLVSRVGFDRVNDTRLRWRDTTRQPAIVYDLAVNETISQPDPQIASGRSLYADTGNWSLFERPSTPTRWEATGRTPIRFERESSTIGPGATGEWLVFLGAHEIHERTAYGQQFRFVVPSAANTSESPDAILDALANSSDALRVGDRDERVFLIAAPTDGVRWGVRGLQTGDSDIWVRDDERLDDADSAWLHEYVHSRQAYTPTSRTLWFSEASASYYAALLSLEHDAIDFTAFDDRLRIGTWPVYDRVILANTSTWVRAPDYYKGTLVAGQLDRRLRVRTDREQTLQDVFRTMNAQQGPVSQLDLLTALATAGDTTLLDVGQRYTESAANVTTWNRTTHAAVFGQLPARIGYELPPVDASAGYEISGPYRNTTAERGDPIVLVTGERLTVDAVVNNAGGTAGQYNLSMRVNGTVVEEAGGRIGASQSTTVPLSHRFPTPGSYVVGVDGTTVNVTVERPASARVVGLTVAESNLRQGESVPLTATVYNDAPVPGEMTVVFTRNFEEVERVHVTLAANSTTFVMRNIDLPTAGRVSLGAGSVRPVAVSVDPAPVQTIGTSTATVTETATATPSTSDRTTQPAEPSRTTSSGAGPGFGPVAAALAMLVVWLGRRRR